MPKIDMNKWVTALKYEKKRASIPIIVYIKKNGPDCLEGTEKVQIN